MATIELDRFSQAYDEDVDLGFLQLQIYAFNSHSNYVPDPYVGYKIQIPNSKYLNLLDDGSRSIGNLIPSKGDEDDKELLLCYGGSVMFGCYSASDSKTIPGYMAKHESISNRYEIKNYALPGGTVLQNFSHFLNYVYPKVNLGRSFHLIFLFGFNEYRALYHYGLKFNEAIVGPLQALIGNTKIAKVLSRQGRIRQINEQRLSDLPDLELASLINQINMFSGLISKLNGKVSFVLQPSLFRSKKVRYGLENTILKSQDSKFNLFVERLSRQITPHQNFIDLSDIFDASSHQVFIDDVHMGCKGNKLIADSLVKRGII